ncbi:rho guanine nucleotide exchange factor 5-like isoform X2 [Mya arenaria]|uniref:rho guanine nucleotide exchange factor 5-like isoform X2 n=1 Tax=Mya arenaria TaxID=6604 RepID=UPI0022E70FE3|nr:rho guanine nucleotide exchange factor 5-like isoform X2 [Mya arenaria]
MASKFGVKLKQADGAGEKSVGQTSYTAGGTRRSDFKTKPVSDLKALFDQTDKEAKESSEILTKKSTKVVTETSSSTQKSSYTKTVKTDNTSQIVGSKKSASATTKITKNSGGQLSEADLSAFEALRTKLNRTGIENLGSLGDGSKPVVAVAKSKTYSGGTTYQATVAKKKVHNADDDDDVKVPATKTQAANFLSFGLTKLRIRPGLLNNEEKSGGESVSMGTSSPRSQSPKPTSPIRKDFGKDKYIPGVAKGWKGSVDVKSKDPGDAGVTKTGKFADSSVGKVRNEVKSENETKVKGFRSVSPVSFQSVDESAGSANLSPRGYKPPKFDFIEKDDKTKSAEIKTDINENIKKFDAAKSNHEMFKLNSDNQGSTPKSDLRKPQQSSASKLISKTESSTIKTFRSDSQLSTLASRANAESTSTTKLVRNDSKPKLSAVEQLALDKEKIKTSRNSGSFSSDSEKGKQSPKVKGEFKWMDKSRISLEEFKEKTKGKSPVQNHRPLSRASSSGSNSSLTRMDGLNMQARVERFGSPELRRNTPSPRANSPLSQSADFGLKRKDFAVSKNSQISVDKFRDLKKGFEGKEKESQSEVSPRKAVDINVNKRLVERKQSFEGGEVSRQKSYENKEVVSPRDRGNVLQTVKALTELDARSKAQTNLVRRTKSLPSDSLEDDSSADYYEDIGSPRGFPNVPEYPIGDDLSNEGDISSDADLIYEEIPASFSLSDPSNKKDFKDRRATAFRKRRKASEEQSKSQDTQTGTEGDIDSDSDSIYEPIDDDVEDEQLISDSDSVEAPPELPPSRSQSSINKKKKKKEGKVEKGEKEKKGFKGKIKQLYKGKSKDTSDLPNTGAATLPAGGVFSKLKRLNKAKSTQSDSNLEALNIEDHPVCDSLGSDSDTEGNDMSQRKTKSEEEQEVDEALAPPPLPPRRVTSSADIKTENEYETPTRSPRNSGHSDNSIRSSSNLEGGRKSPPLPARNRVSNHLDLNTVIPVNPGGNQRKSDWPPTKDSYLHSQKINNAEIPYMDDSPSPKPSPDREAPPLPTRPVPVAKRHLSSTSSTSSYVDADSIPPPRPTSKPPLLQQDSYVDTGDDPLPDDNYSLAEEIRKELERRPISSAYIKPTDLSTVPPHKTMTAPFQDMIQFCSQYDEDGLYIDLSSGHFVRRSELRDSGRKKGEYVQPTYSMAQSDDQVYGTASRYKSKFESESLYQFYNKDKIHRASRRKAIYSSFDESDEEDDSSPEKETIYEDLSEYSSGRGSLEIEKRVEEAKETRDSKISTLEMFGKKGTMLRALWAEMQEVKDSGVLETITPHERKLQETMFEILTSEATYLKSINVLIDVFLMSEEFGSEIANKCVLTKPERHVIFSNIGAIRDASQSFLADLEARWKESVVLTDICDIIVKHASGQFEGYVHYCSNQAFQDRAVMDLRKKPEFAEALRRLESHPDCQGLPMISFLLLPMQRVTRLPLLVDAICHRMDPVKDKERHKSATKACTALSKVVRRCNDGAKKMQQTEQMYHIAQQIEFPSTKEIAQIPLISSSRFLVKQGEVIKIINKAAIGLPFGKAKSQKEKINLYLFNDILLITKKKGDKYIVTDYSQRNALHVEVIDNPDKNTRVLPYGVPGGCKNLLLLAMLENHEKKQVEMVLACNTTSDRARWVDAVTPVRGSDAERIYEEWDCPQVQCVKAYIAREPDELALDESDVVNVFKKLDDDGNLKLEVNGMYEGERLRDGERGWFPKDHTIEIVNSHVRARNLRMKYRLMAAADYGNPS